MATFKERAKIVFRLYDYSFGEDDPLLLATFDSRLDAEDAVNSQMLKMDREVKVGWRDYYAMKHLRIVEEPYIQAFDRWPKMIGP